MRPAPARSPPTILQPDRRWPSIRKSPTKLSGPSSPLTTSARLLSFKGIAEGVENSNFLLHDRGRILHPDALREARERGRTAVLSRPHGTSRSARHHLPAAGQEPPRRGARPHCRPPRGDRHLPRRHVDPAPEAAPLRECSAKRSRSCTRPAPISGCGAHNALSLGGWPRAFDRAEARADEVPPGLAAGDRGRIVPSRRRLADAICPTA